MQMGKLTTLMAMMALGLAQAAERGHLGVFLQPLDEDLKAAYEFQGNGVLISSVVEDSGAEAAGIRSGDIILKVAGQPVTSAEEVVHQLEGTQSGDVVDLVIFRDKEEKTLTVELRGKALFPRTARKDPQRWLYFFDDNRPFMGIEMQNLSDQLAEFFGVQAGVLVSEVTKESPAEQAGLMAGDIITKLDQVNITDSSSVLKALGDYEPGHQVTVTINRKGTVKELNLVLGDRKDARAPHIEFFDDQGHHFKLPPNAPYQFQWKDAEEFRPFLWKPGEDGEMRKEMDALKKELQMLKEQLKDMKQ